jgi:hypothetical protein
MIVSMFDIKGKGLFVRVFINPGSKECAFPIGKRKAFFTGRSSEGKGKLSFIKVKVRQIRHIKSIHVIGV